jgi:hypothetical protein
MRIEGRFLNEVEKAKFRTLTNSKRNVAKEMVRRCHLLL